MKKVTFVDHDCGITGSTVSLKYIIDFFVKAGMSVDVITAKPEHLLTVFSDLGARCFPVAKSKCEPLFLDLHFSSALVLFSRNGLGAIKTQIMSLLNGIGLGSRILKATRPDLVYLNEYVSLHVGFAAKLLRIPVVMHVRSRFTSGTVGIRPFFLRHAARRICDGIIAITKIEAEQFMYADSDAISVIGEFLDDNNFSPSSDAKALRKTFNIPDGPLIVSMLGGIVDFKGTYEYLQAAQMILSKRSDIVFVVAGPEGRSEDYVRKCREFPSLHGGQKNVFFLNTINNPKELLSISDILVSPTLVTHFSRPVLEAWALKKAVIATNTAHLRNLINDGVNGLLVKTGSATEMAQAVEKLFAEPDLRKELGQNGYTKAKLEFDSKRNIGKIFELCQKIAESRNKIT